MDSSGVLLLVSKMLYQCAWSLYERGIAVGPVIDIHDAPLPSAKRITAFLPRHSPPLASISGVKCYVLCCSCVSEQWKLRVRSLI